MADDQALARLRRRLDDLARRLEFRDPAPRGGSASQSIVGQVYDGGARPTTGGHYFLVHPGRLGGVPAEGGAASNHFDAARSIAVYAPGATVPAVGDVVVARQVPNGRWVVEAGGGSPGISSFFARGCMLTGVAGAVVTISSGATPIAACTTGDGTGGTFLGRCFLDIPGGTYNIRVEPPVGSGFDTYVGTFTAGDSATIDLVADSDHICTSACNFPLKKTLNGSYLGSGFTLTWTGGMTWVTAAATVNTQVYRGDAAVPPNCVDDGMTLDVSYSFTVFGTSASFGIRWKVFICFLIPGISGGCVPTNDPAAAEIGAGDFEAFPTPCHPLNMTFSLPASTSQPTVCGFNLAGTPGGGGLVTVTE